ncbi:hypothetical protein GCM10027613_02920 [Microlunatus endophyticus]
MPTTNGARTLPISLTKLAVLISVAVLCMAAGFVAAVGVVHGGWRIGGAILGVLGIAGLAALIVVFPVVMVRRLTGLPANPLSAESRALTDSRRAEWAPGRIRILPMSSRSIQASAARTQSPSRMGSWASDRR